MGESRRVALLARPGEACERLRAALREAGGDIVLEADPSSLDPQALRAAAAQTVLVALDPAVEDALEKFDDVLSDRAVEVIFDEADLAARREGWDAARWVRHLAAKLHRHDDVLPPGREPDTAAFAEQNEVPMEELPEVEAIELDVAALDAVDLEALAFDVEVEAAAEPEQDIVLEALPDDAENIELADETPVAFGGLSLTDDLDALEFEGGDISVASDVPAPSLGEDVQDFDALMRDLGATEGSDGDETIEMPPVRAFAPTEALPSLDFDIAPVDAPTKKEADLAMPDFGSLSLEAVSEAPAGMTLRSTDGPFAPAPKPDLSELERRISSLELVDTDAPAQPKAEAVSKPATPTLDIPALEPIPALDAIPGFDVVETTPTPTAAPANTGAVLILAGIGGPDAVRQILTALPDGFARPVFISQRLDGGRYDRLVQQMARAAALPVHLAEADAAVAPGHVYILPPELGVDAANGLRFIAGASQLDGLPADDTAVLLLSGADPALVDAALALGANGALVAGQSPEGCYDATAPSALVARGGTAGTPHELVQSLLQRWPA